MSTLSRNDELPQVISVAPCEGWLAEYADRDGGPPIWDRVVAFGILRSRDEGGIFHEATALVVDGAGGLVPASDAGNFVRIVHREDLEPEEASRLIRGGVAEDDSAPADSTSDITD